MGREREVEGGGGRWRWEGEGGGVEWEERGRGRGGEVTMFENSFTTKSLPHLDHLCSRAVRA